MNQYKKDKSSTAIRKKVYQTKNPSVIGHNLALKRIRFSNKKKKHVFPYFYWTFGLSWTLKDGSKFLFSLIMGEKTAIRFDGFCQYNLFLSKVSFLGKVFFFIFSPLLYLFAWNFSQSFLVYITFWILIDSV